MKATNEMWDAGFDALRKDPHAKDAAIEQVVTIVLEAALAAAPTREPTKEARLMREAAERLDYMATQAAGHAKQLHLSNHLRAVANDIDAAPQGLREADRIDIQRILNAVTESPYESWEQVPVRRMEVIGLCAHLLELDAAERDVEPASQSDALSDAERTLDRIAHCSDLPGGARATAIAYFLRHPNALEIVERLKVRKS